VGIAAANDRREGGQHEAKDAAPEIADETKPHRSTLSPPAPCAERTDDGHLFGRRSEGALENAQKETAPVREIERPVVALDRKEIAHAQRRTKSLEIGTDLPRPRTEVVTGSPFAEKRESATPDHPLVGRPQESRGRIDDARMAVGGKDPGRPAASSHRPVGAWEKAAASATGEHGTGDRPADVPPSGCDDKILRRHAKTGSGGEGRCEMPGAKESGERPHVVVRRRILTDPDGHKDMTRAGSGDDRPPKCRPHTYEHCLATAHGDAVHDHPKTSDSAPRSILPGVSRHERHAKKHLVGHHGIGHAPGDRSVRADGDAGHTRKRDPHRTHSSSPPRAVDKREAVPDRRKIERKMRIVGQKSMPGASESPGHRKGVARRARGREVTNGPRWRRRHGRVEGEDLRTRDRGKPERSALVGGVPTVSGGGKKAIKRVRKSRAQRAQRTGETVGGALKIAVHVGDDQIALPGLPWSRGPSEDPVGERTGGGVAECRVHARRVGGEEATGARRIPTPDALREAAKSVTNRLSVRREGHGPEKRRESSLGASPQEIHLEVTLRPFEVPLSEVSVPQ
jgi:hypothetical protein